MPVSCQQKGNYYTRCPTSFILFKSWRNAQSPSPPCSHTAIHHIKILPHPLFCWGSHNATWDFTNANGITNNSTGWLSLFQHLHQLLYPTLSYSPWEQNINHFYVLMDVQRFKFFSVEIMVVCIFCSTQYWLHSYHLTLKKKTFLVKDPFPSHPLLGFLLFHYPP